MLRSAQEALLAQPPDSLDHTLIRDSLAIIDTLPADRFYEALPELIRRSEPRLGRLPAGSPDRTYALAGYCSSTHVILHINMVRLVDPVQGATALVRWLKSRGFKQFRYEFVPSFDDEYLDSENTSEDENPTPTPRPNADRKPESTPSTAPGRPGGGG